MTTSREAAIGCWDTVREPVVFQGPHWLKTLEDGTLEVVVKRRCGCGESAVVPHSRSEYCHVSNSVSGSVGNIYIANGITSTSSLLYTDVLRDRTILRYFSTEWIAAVYQDDPLQVVERIPPDINPNPKNSKDSHCDQCLQDSANASSVNRGNCQR